MQVNFFFDKYFLNKRTSMDKLNVLILLDFYLREQLIVLLWVFLKEKYFICHYIIIY